MITNCVGVPYFNYGIEDVLIDAGALLIAVVPAAITYALWRMFVTNRRAPIGTTTLGLDENSTTYTKLYDPGTSWRTLFLYGLTGVVFAFESFQYLVDLLFSASL